MGAILGGLFNSRLNMNLREEKGYTYGASAGFDLRRARGPVRRARRRQHRGHRPGHPARFLAELDRIREAPVTDAELRPPATSSSACSRSGSRRRVPSRARWPGCSSTACPTTSWTATGAPIEAVTADDVLRVARAHIRPEAAAIVLVGDADAVRRGARARRPVGPVEVVRDTRRGGARKAETFRPGPASEG